MKERIKNFFKNPAFFVAIILFFLPFFWMKPGEANMGGDGGSLYYYDPINFIKNYIIFNIYPFGTGIVEARSFYLPFVAVLAGFNMIFSSGYLVSVLHNSIKLSLGFLSVYWIMKELLPQLKIEIKQKKLFNLDLVEIIAIISGYFYIFSPILTKDDRFINPIPSHDQVFLNPLIFYLLLRYFVTNKMYYIWIILFLSFVFAHSFSYSAVPALFSFYPVALLFLILYTLFILKKKIPVKGIVIGVIFFIFLHLFHLGPLFLQLFDPSSDANTRVFNGNDRIATVGTFYGVIGFASLPGSLLLQPISGGIWIFFSSLSSLIILLGFLKNITKSRLFLLTSFLFLMTLYLISAKVSYSGIKLYELFFLHIPGFGMFRWFFIQWMFVFIFFFSLLFGQSLFIILSSGQKYRKTILLFIFVYLIGSSWVFIRGDQFALTHFQSNNIKRLVAMDPQYEKMLEFIRNIPHDGKILQFPFSDFNFQVIHGSNDGAYVGTSTIGQLTGVKDFSGYWNIAPYSEAFLQFAKDKNYSDLKKIISFLNIRYIFYNSDPKTYDNTFPTRPFEYVKKSLPKTQKEYQEFIKPLIKEEIYETGHYKLFSVAEESFLPHFYIPKETNIYTYNSKYDRYYNAASSFLLDSPLSTRSAEKSHEQRVAYIEKSECANKTIINTLCRSNVFFEEIPNLYFRKINPVKYSVVVSNVKQPLILVFSEAFHKDWKLFISEDVQKEDSSGKYFNSQIVEGKVSNTFLNQQIFETLSLKNLSESQHFVVNGYANAWYITPQDIGENGKSLIIEMTGQRLYYITFLISFVAFLILIFWGFLFFFKKKL